MACHTPPLKKQRDKWKYHYHSQKTALIFVTNGVPYAPGNEATGTCQTIFRTQGISLRSYLNKKMN